MNRWKLTTSTDLFDGLVGWWGLRDESNSIVIDKTDDGIFIRVAVPGIDKDDLEVKLHKSIVEIIYEGESYFVKSFSHAVDISGYDRESIIGHLDNGVLTIWFSKREELKPKSIKF